MITNKICILYIVYYIGSIFLSHSKFKNTLKHYFNSDIYFNCFRVLADNPIKEIHPRAFLNNIRLKRL